MTYTTFWPASLPRQAPEYAGDYFLVQPIDGDIVAGGSWGDGSDDSYVSLFNDYTTAGDQQGSIVAVDFAPIPNIDTSRGFVSMGLVVRLQGVATDANAMLWALYDPAGNNIYQGTGNDFLYAAPSGLPITSPTTVAGAQDEDTIYVGFEPMLTDGFTLVVAATDSADYAGSIFETWRIFEWGLVFDVIGEPQPSPQPYRARQRLHPIAPARRWPREAWQGSSSRRVGGYR